MKSIANNKSMRRRALSYRLCEEFGRDDAEACKNDVASSVFCRVGYLENLHSKLFMQKEVFYEGIESAYHFA